MNALPIASRLYCGATTASDEDTRMIGAMSGSRGVLFATAIESSTSDLSIRMSVNGGRTWRRQTFGLPESWHTFSMERVLQDTVYFFAAEKNVPGQQPALYRSVDGKLAEHMNPPIDYGS
ncbi:hypothetical protein [Massilia sp. Leaf139]|uniref:hypothetical protein n=1 Tax=Massilia sp. Leaf139 TaxID=1736272 RepID=UPI0012E7F219|nr:hypothetical protein [Massilia sp. Leaf139]